MKYINTILLLGLSLQLSAKEIDNPDRYKLPSSKANIAICKQKVLSLHPGMVEKELILHKSDDFHILFEVEGENNSEWSIDCDLKTGKITKEQIIHTE